MNKIKNKIFLFIIFAFLISVSNANPEENSAKTHQNEISKCEKCIVEDDEYCIYNQCYFDKQYRLMKNELQLSESQEECIDNIYQNFKTDLEILCARYQCEKERLLELIAQDGFYSRQKHLVKDIKQDIKEKYKDYIKDVRNNLCRKQKKKYNKFVRKQKKKIKAIVKYGAIYKFPCSSGCQN